jgi:hypothetical protein
MWTPPQAKEKKEAKTKVVGSSSANHVQKGKDGKAKKRKKEKGGRLRGEKKNGFACTSNQSLNG